MLSRSIRIQEVIAARRGVNHHNTREQAGHPRKYQRNSGRMHRHTRAAEAVVQPPLFRSSNPTPFESCPRHPAKTHRIRRDRGGGSGIHRMFDLVTCCRACKESLARTSATLQNRQGCKRLRHSAIKSPRRSAGSPETGTLKNNWHSGRRSQCRPGDHSRSQSQTCERG